MGIRTARQMGLATARRVVGEDPMQILIVGAGIAGLSLAKALEQRGMAADLVERQTGELAVGAGLYLVGNATRALQQLGLLADVAGEGRAH
jgi:2-polyprenyl-6-methoxyphenol hydroxylase-like FAD-dependent oxidoreductase